jgi:hypothetical protein
MDDVAAVSALVHAYAERLDRGDLDGVADLFARAVWRSAQAPNGIRGRDAIRHVYDGVRLTAGSPRTRHLLTDLVVDVDETAGTATATCAFTVIHAPVDGVPRPILAGRYRDAFARDGDAWHFTERVTEVELTGGVGAHYGPVPPSRPAG